MLKDTEQPVPCIVNMLRERRVELFIEDRRLRYRAPAGELSPSDVATLRQRRDEILRYLMACEIAERSRALPQDPRIQPSLLQESWWHTYRESQTEAVGNCIPLVLDFEDMSPEDVRSLLRRLIARHDVLLYSFLETDEGLCVQLNSSDQLAIDSEDLYAIPECTRRTALQARVAQFSQIEISVRGPLLMRCRIFLETPGTGLVLLLMHHIVADYSSLEIIRRDWHRLREDHAKPNHAPDTPASVRFRHYAAWERSWFSGEAAQRLADYWTHWLRGLPCLAIPGSDAPLEWRPGTPVVHILEFPRAMAEQTQAQCIQYRTTPFLLFLARYCTTLASCTTVHRFAVLSISDARHYDDTPELGLTAGLMGYLDPVEAFVPSSAPLRDVLQSLSRSHMAARRLRFPLNLCRPGLREAEFHRKVGATINFLYIRPPAAHPGPDVHDSGETNIISRSVVRLPATRTPMSPIEFAVDYSSDRIRCRFSINDAQVPSRWQDTLVDTFVKEVQQLTE